MCVAILAHIALLGVSIRHTEYKPNTTTVFNVTLLEEPSLDETAVKETERLNDKQPETQQQTSNIEPAEPTVEKPQPPQDILVVEQNKQPEPRTKIETSVSSTSFRAWLETETQTFTTTNPESVAKFDDTFSPEPIYISPRELSPYNPKSVPRGSTTFKTELNGKVTCKAKILDMLDVSAGPSFTAKDCTPPKKFELNLAKPNNGWMAR